MSAVLTPADLGAVIRARRRSMRLTQAELAERSGVGRQWLVAVERGHSRAELGKVNAVLDATGLMLMTRPSSAGARGQRDWLTAGDAAAAIRREVASGEVSFALRVLATALADLRGLTDAADVALALAEPPSTGDPRWDTLVAASFGRECRNLGLAGPAWANVDALPSWWFPIYDPILTARTMQRTPIDFASRGIWLDGHALEVV